MPRAHRRCPANFTTLKRMARNLIKKSPGQDLRPLKSFRFRLNRKDLSYDFSRLLGEKEPLGEGCRPLVSGEGWIEERSTV